MLSNKISIPSRGKVPTRVGLGTMMMGWRVDSKESQKIFSLAYECGVRIIDTSVSYSRGRCHEIISKALSDLKLINFFYIATKVGGISSDNDPPEYQGYSKNNIISQCDLSLSQLKVDCIDLLQLHTPPDIFQYEEVFEALGILIAKGKIRGYGVCNCDETDISELLTYANRNHFPGPLTCQFEYNLINAKEKSLMFKFLDSTSLKTLTWGPLAGGLLTDWYLKNDCLRPNSRLYIGRERVQKEAVLKRKSTRHLLREMAIHCSKLNISAQLLSLLWILKKHPYNVPLLGPSSSVQFLQMISGIERHAHLDLEAISFDSLLS